MRASPYVVTPEIRKKVLSMIDQSIHYDLINERLGVPHGVITDIKKTEKKRVAEEAKKAAIVRPCPDAYIAEVVNPKPADVPDWVFRFKRLPKDMQRVVSTILGEYSVSICADGSLVVQGERVTDLQATQLADRIIMRPGGGA